MQMRASFTVERVPLPPEQAAVWRASMQVFFEFFQEYMGQQQAIPVEMPVKGEIHVEG